MESLLLFWDTIGEYMSKSSIRTVMAVAACKLTRAGLRLLKRGGTALPGKVAARIDPNVLERVSREVKIIVVTGTNGKTTTSNMISHAITDAGKACLANRSGANLLSGVTAEFCCSASFTGMPGYRYAVIECDEGALKQVVPLIHPEVIVVTNLFRDQLDRYGEVMHTLEAIQEGIRHVPEAAVCLNADCSLTSSLALSIPNPVFYFGLDTPIDDFKESDLSDARHCIRCGTEYSYHYHTYAHLGDFYCPKCGYSRQKPQVAVQEIRSISAGGSSVVMRIGRDLKEVEIHLPAIYNIYNAAAAVCGYLTYAKCLGKKGKSGLPQQQIFDSLADVKSSFGRMENFDLEGVRLQMILVKNPAGCNQAISYLVHLKQDYQLVLCLNDRTADGHDISWIWDADYEMFAEDACLKKVYVCGDRAADMQLRLKYAGLPTEKISLIKDYHTLLEVLSGVREPVFALPNYTSMLSLREVVGHAAGKSDFWEG